MSVAAHPLPGACRPGVPTIHALPAARRLAAQSADLLVVAESACQREGCAPDCPVAVAARSLAVQAAGLAQDLLRD